MNILWAFIAGLIMGMGLIIADMVNPLRVQGFLDIFGLFDPSLVFTMAGALMTTMVGYYFIRKYVKKPLCEVSFDNPSNTVIDKKLIGGSILFGIGWALAGFCPAPALVGVGFFAQQAMVVVMAMLLGMWFIKKIN